MQSLLESLDHGKMTEVLLTVGWADKHPMLFTIIQITNPTLYFALFLAGVTTINGIVRGKRK